MKILGIETSCDETSVAVLEDANIISNEIYSQAIHENFGGVVPELASRVHQKVLYGLCEKALKDARMNVRDIDLISVTRGPGLVGALLNGLCFAKGLALSLNKPLIGANHLEGHLWAFKLEGLEVQPPFCGMLVSGGHTVLLKVSAFGKYEIIGETVDDAAGEAFDKVGKLLSIDYPAGPVIDKLAKQGDSSYFKFPKVRVKKNPLNFSFSGLKTAARLFIESLSPEDKKNHLNDICASFQKTVVDELVGKTLKAAEQHKLRTVVLAGGVAANSELKIRFNDECKKRGIKLLAPPIKLCTDNAAMIAYAGYLNFQSGNSSLLDIGPKPRWPLG